MDKWNIYGAAWQMEHYNVKENSEIDFDNVREMALLHQPKLIIAGASIYPRDQDYKKFREIADEVGVNERTVRRVIRRLAEKLEE